MEQNKLVAEVRRTLSEWDAARQEADRVRGQFVASGPVQRGSRIQWPERILNEQGVKDIHAAEAVEQEKWNAHQEAITAWRKTSGS